jgi:hypothetical protein
VRVAGALGAQVNSTEGDEVVRSWPAIAEHAAGPSCIGPGRPCSEVTRIVRSGGTPMSFATLHEVACEVGRPLLEEWQACRDVLNSRYRDAHR